MITLALALVLAAPPAFVAKERFLADAKALVPTRQEVPKVLRALGGVALLAALDERPSEQLARHAPATLSRFEPLGRYGVGNALGAAFLGFGVAARDPRAASAGVAFLEANLVSSLLVSGIQRLAGRARPGYPHAGSFGQGGSSFPSAHAAHAFAWAGVAYASFPEFRYRWVFPAVAGAVAASRVADGKHFVADVVCGGLVGWWVGERLGESAARYARLQLAVGPKALRVALTLP